MFKRAVSMGNAIKGNKESNIETDFKRKRTVIKTEGVNEADAL